MTVNGEPIGTQIQRKRDETIHTISERLATADFDKPIQKELLDQTRKRLETQTDKVSAWADSLPRQEGQFCQLAYHISQCNPILHCNPIYGSAVGLEIWESCVKYAPSTDVKSRFKVMDAMHRMLLRTIVIVPGEVVMQTSNALSSENSNITGVLVKATAASPIKWSVSSLGIRFSYTFQKDTRSARFHEIFGFYKHAYLDHPKETTSFQTELSAQLAQRDESFIQELGSILNKHPANELNIKSSLLCTTSKKSLQLRYEVTDAFDKVLGVCTQKFGWCSATHIPNCKHPTSSNCLLTLVPEQLDTSWKWNKARKL